MEKRIEDYAMIGDCRTGALISRDGSIDWFCVPRFDSGACFSTLLGSPENGHWQLAPRDETRRTRRQYLGDSLILETTLETEDGSVALIDFMPMTSKHPQIVRIVEGRSGQVAMNMELIIRFNYGSIIPWVRRVDHAISALAGASGIYVHSEVPMRGEDLRTVAEFNVSEGQRIPFVLAWHHSYEDPTDPVDPETALQETRDYWKDWTANIRYEGRWREAVVRSMITLKGLSYSPTGGLLAALTTSLPESPGGQRNWDYRFCWLRDATFSLYAFLACGRADEAEAWRDWLHRAVAGEPSQIQNLYVLDGERWLHERELGWLPGFNGAQPVRIGNAASDQVQLDVFGEIMDVFHIARRSGIDPDKTVWQVQRAMLDHLESVWEEPDSGIWEFRGHPVQLTHSNAMVWVAFDRAVKAVEQFGLEGPVEKWRSLRGKVHEQVCQQGFNRDLNSFVQSYGSEEIDASLLMLPVVGFLPPDDPRILGTIEAIRRELDCNGLIRRYRTQSGFDGLDGNEGAFLVCNFWLVDALALTGRQKEAEDLFERILTLRNDVGLLSEEYDTERECLLGNFPQAFSHVGLINSAQNLRDGDSPSKHRSESSPSDPDAPSGSGGNRGDS